MSRSDWRFREILVLRTDADRYARGGRIGPLGYRHLGRPPADGGGAWYPGCDSDGEPPGVLGALAEDLPRRVALRAYVATLSGSTVAEWRAQLPGVIDAMRDARQDWDLPSAVVITRARSAQIELDILERWPGIRVVWLGTAKAERPSSATLAEVTATK